MPGFGLCPGDFQVQENEVVALAYTDYQEGVVVIRNGQGKVLSRHTPDADYVGYPTFGPGGDLVFYSAALAETDSMPLAEVGTIHRSPRPRPALRCLPLSRGWCCPTVSSTRIA